MRVRATNDEGTTTSADTTFTTAPGDGDGDGVAPPLDCNDANAAIHPGAVDKPGDKIDQDCSGTDAAFPVLEARANFSWGFSGSRTALTKVDGLRPQGRRDDQDHVQDQEQGLPVQVEDLQEGQEGHEVADVAVRAQAAAQDGREGSRCG